MCGSTVPLLLGQYTCREPNTSVPRFPQKEENMHSRLITCTINPAKLNDFKNALNNQFLPRIQAQPGFVDNIESLDPATGQFSCMTLWKTASDVENYDRSEERRAGKRWR